MPTTLTGVNTGFDNTVPAPADNDVANGALFQAMSQRHANNDKSLYEQITNSGVLAIRNVATTAALKALTGMITGQVAYVRGNGLYFYIDPDATTEALPWIAAPTVGTGRWFHSLNSLRNAASGVPTLDGSGRLTSTAVTNRIVSSYYADADALFTVLVSGTSAVQVITSRPSLTGIAVGDLIELDIAGYASTTNNSAAETLTVQAVFNDGSDHVSTVTRWLGSTASATSFCLTARFTATSTTDIALGLQAKSSASATGFSTNVTSIRARQIRP